MYGIFHFSCTCTCTRHRLSASLPLIHQQNSSTNFEDTLRLVKEFLVDVWEVRKQKLYGEDTCPSHHQCQTLAGDAGPVTGGGGLRVSNMGRLGKLHVCSGNVHTSDCGSTLIVMVCDQWHSRTVC